MKPLFHIMEPDANGEHRVVATFYAKDDQALLEMLRERAPGMMGKEALVAVNAPALEILLRHSVNP